MKNKLVKLGAVLVCIAFTFGITACTAILADFLNFPEADPIVVADGDPVVSADQANKEVKVSDEKVLKAEINEEGQLVITPLKWGTADVTFYDEENDADVIYQFKVTTKGELSETSHKKLVRSYEVRFGYLEVDGGIITANKTTARAGETISLTVTTFDGYTFEGLTVNQGSNLITLTNNNTFTMPKGNVVVNATFKAIDYKISFASMTNGSVTTDKTTVHVGDSIVLNVTPKDGYELGTLTVTSGNQDVEVRNNVFIMPAGNVTVYATFVLKKYNISIAADIKNGTVVADKTSANADEIITLTATPEEGYHLEAYNVTSDGQQITVNNNQFKMPKGDVTVSATFAAGSYTISVDSNIEHGSISADKATAHVGDEIILTDTPDDGYRLDAYSVTSGGQEITVRNDTFKMPAGDVTVSATFTAINYKVSISSTPNGTVTASKTSANVDEIITLTATPDNGYNLAGFTVTSGGQNIEVKDNSFKMPSGNVTVNATFAAVSYTISVDSNIEHGSVTADKTTANFGDVITLTATPANGYQFGAFTVTSNGQTVTVTDNSFTMPAGNVTVSATFTAVGYTVGVATMTHGSVTASKTTANVGEEITLTATPNAGYTFGEYTVTSGAQQIELEGNTFTMPAGNVVISATFTAIDYSITLPASITGGTVTASKSTAHVDDEITLTATPVDGYQFGAFTVTSGGQTVTLSANNTFTMPAGNVTVSATFTAIGYSITLPTSITGGTVTASKSTASVGEEITLTATPSAGYNFGAFTVTSGGQTVTLSGNETFTMPAGDVTVSATFTAIDYLVSVAATTNGSVTASKTSNAHVGDIITLTASPNDGYQFGAFTVTSNGQTVTVTDNSFTMPAGNVTVSATFTAVGYTVGVATMTHGSVTANKTTANVGEEITLTATPNAGYTFGEYIVTSGGQSVTVSTNGTFTMPAGNVAISATFTAIDYSITLPASITGGTVTASKSTAHVDDEITLTATPANGYQFGAFTVTSNGQTVTVTDNSFTMPAGNVTVSVTFTAIDYTVSVAATTNGSVTASKTSNAHVGDIITLTASPNAGYQFGAFTVTSGGQTVTLSANNTFTMPAGNVTVSATFTAIDYSITLPTSITGGSVTANKTTASVGETVTLTATPNAGYQFGAFTVTSGGQQITVSNNNTFIMPAGNVTVSATFEEVTYSVGDVLLNTGTIIPHANVNTMTADQKAAAVGVLYALDENGTPRGWLGLYNSAGGTNWGTYAWAKADSTGFNTKFEDIICTPSVTGSGAASTATFTGDTDGSNNWTEICTVDSTGTLEAARNYPAFNYVNNYVSTFNLTGSYATGWYMPSLAELCYIYRNKDRLNEALNTLGGIQLDEDYYWSSSQYANYGGDLGNAWLVYFGGGYIDYDFKCINFRVCCVHKFSFSADSLQNYPVSISNMTNGTVGTDKTTAHAGETVTLTVAPSSSYILYSLNVKDSSNAKITITKDPSDSTKYTFTMPDTIVKVSATFGEVRSVGDVLLNTGTIIPYANVNTMSDDQKAAAVGVLYALDENGTPRGWLGLYNSAGGTNSGNYKWAPTGTTGYNTKFEDIICTPSAEGPGAASTATFTGDTDGSNNWAYICSQDSSGTTDAATNYPAFNYVNNYASTFNLTGDYATGWYMPSLAELCYIYRNKSVLNSVLTALGGIQLGNYDYYWSSSQHDYDFDYGLARDVSFYDGYVDTSEKDLAFRVCCVRAF